MAVLGLGNLGAEVARHLSRTGFRTLGWARSPKQIEGVECFDGPHSLDEVLAQADIVVNMLPLTPATEDMVDAAFLGKMKRGAAFINTARGRHVVEEDLLAALDAGQLSHATLDVFRQEPLPEDSPFWSHPGVTITPHISSIADPETGAVIVAENVRRFEETGEWSHLVDVAAGY
ncbi:NAD(P)-dependent oxidoreductase [Pseudooceanicola marinus]|uniref:NAD(P)-dependent oxidoreductase n=1 Tax=Pseudooceanicola marinus TaxID=396013 RepID=UPI001CD56827|nr:NAD(P)-dependent oxidoreductase [Pseudooceanicola marinus]MCA1334543.1 hypothetical protein [Pseudooceanicola marinus]